MTTSPKFSLHSQWEHPFPSELLLYTNQRGQLLVFVMVWTLLGWKSAATICIKWEGAQNIIIESVDSICRDSADTQYMPIQTNLLKISKTANLWAVTTPYRSSSSVFMTNNTPSGAKMHRESTVPESRQTAKMFFFLLIFRKFRLLLLLLQTG